MNRILILASLLAWSLGSTAQTCEANQEQLKAMIQKEAKLPSDFSVRAAEMPRLEAAVLSIQVDIAQSQHPRVVEVTVCEVNPFPFVLKKGSITSTSVEIDSESVWLIGLGPTDERFLLAGFSDPRPDFNALVRRLGLTIGNAEAARGLFDLYLKLAAGHEFREDIIVDDLQPQSMGLTDFRLHYSLPKARILYAKWWSSIKPAIKNALRRPEVARRSDGFKVTYFRYFQGRILQETITIAADGTVTLDGSKTISVPSKETAVAAAVNRQNRVLGQ